MCGRERGRAWERQNLWVDIDGCRTGSEGTTGIYVSPPPRRDPRLRDSVGSMRRAATATAVAVNASRRGGSRYPCTDRSARVYTHVTPSRYRRRESGCEIVRSGCRRREESVADRGSRAGNHRGVVEPFRQFSSDEEEVASSCASTTAAIFDGSCRRATSWFAAPRVERGRKRGGKLALIEAGDSSHAHPGSCKRSTAVKEKETKREKEGKIGARGETGKAIVYIHI